MNKRDQEILDMLAEEAAEVIQNIMKINRHGIESYHPDNPSKSNRDLLKEELTDLLALIGETEKNIVGNINSVDIEKAWQKKIIWSHFQETDE